jgi:hypothetical protein
VHQAFSYHFGFGVPIKNQEPVEWRINLKRAKALKGRIPKMAKASQIRLTRKLEQCQIYGGEKTPGNFFSRFIEIPRELTGDIGMEQRRFLNGKIHRRFSRTIRSHAARISSEEYGE